MSDGKFDCPPSTATDATMAMSPRALLRMMSPRPAKAGHYDVRLKPDTTKRLAAVLNLASARRQHQLHEFFRDLWLQAFRVSFVNAHNVGDDAAVTATSIHEHVCFARPRTQSPRFRSGILSRAVEHVAGLGVGHVAALRLGCTRVLLCARRCLRQ